MSGASIVSRSITSSPSSEPLSRSSSTRATRRVIVSYARSWSSWLSVGDLIVSVTGTTSSAACARASSVRLSEVNVVSRWARMSRGAISPTARFSWPTVMFADSTRNSASATRTVTISARPRPRPARGSSWASVRGMNIGG